MGEGHSEVMDAVVAVGRVGGGAFVGDAGEVGRGTGESADDFAEDFSVRHDVVFGIGGGELFFLVESDVDELEVADVFGEDDCLGSDREVDEVVGLDVVDGADEAVGYLVEVVGGEFTGVDDGAERSTVDVVGDYAATDARHVVDVVDHDYMGVSEIVAHIKFALHHALHPGIVAELRLKGLKHYPFAMLAGGPDLVVFLVPSGKVFQFSPLVVGIVAHRKKKM